MPTGRARHVLLRGNSCAGDAPQEGEDRDRRHQGEGRASAEVECRAVVNASRAWAIRRSSVRESAAPRLSWAAGEAAFATAFAHGGSLPHATAVSEAAHGG
ncbi:hypothetical protein ASC82_01120 [Streptomyces sp. Root431]|nr:hypothetical protein ASC82_01120 [Streptomyces sp. Root431]